MKVLAVLICCLLVCGYANAGESKVKDISAGETAKVTGQSTGFKLFGVIDVIHPSYNQATANLHSNVAGEAQDKGYELENVTQEETTSNFLLFSIPKKKVSADVKAKR